MNTVLIDDKNFMETESYKKFMDANPKSSYLKIQAFKANQAIPVSGVEIIVSHIIDNYKVIFYEGKTNESGIIENILLPVPECGNNNDLKIPLSTTYNVEAIYTKDNLDSLYKVKMFNGIYAVQDIDVSPNIESWEL